MNQDRSHQPTANGLPDPNQLDLFGSQTAPLVFLNPAPAPEEQTLCRIGHDLRTALNAILGFSEIMTQKLHGPLGHPKYDEYAQHVRFSGQALLTVSDEVLALAGRGLIRPRFQPASA